MKEKFKRLLAQRTIHSKTNTRNNMLTTCELLCEAYYKCVNANNIIGDLDGSGLWRRKKNNVDPMRVTAQQCFASFITKEKIDLLLATCSAYTIVKKNDRAAQPEQQLSTYKQLQALFLRRGDYLASDSVVEANSTVALKTICGATLTSDNAIRALQLREEKLQEKEVQRRQTCKERERKEKERENKSGAR